MITEMISQALSNFQQLKQPAKLWKNKTQLVYFKKFADFWDGMKDEVDELFGQSEEDLIFRKLTGIDELFVEGKIR